MNYTHFWSQLQVAIQGEKNPTQMYPLYMR